MKRTLWLKVPIIALSWCLVGLAYGQAVAESIPLDFREFANMAISQATEGKPALDFGHIEMRVEGNGVLVGFASMMEEPKPLPNFLQHNIGLIPIAETAPRTFAIPWIMVGVGAEEKTKLETFLELANAGPGTLTITRRYFNQEGVDCTLGGSNITVLGPRMAATLRVSSELLHPCPAP